MTVILCDALKYCLTLFLLTLSSVLFAEQHATSSNLETVTLHHRLIYADTMPGLPLLTLDKNNHAIGIIADYLNDIEKRLGIKFKVKSVQSQQVSMTKLQQGLVDVISVNADVKHQPELDYSRPLFSSPIVMVMQSNHRFVDSIAAIQYKKIAFLSGYDYINNIIKHYPDIDFIEYGEMDDALTGISIGQIDVLLAPLAIVEYKINAAEHDNVRVLGKTKFTDSYTLAVRKDNDLAPLIPALNQAIEGVTPAQHSHILNKWKITNKSPFVYNFALQSIVITLIVITFFMLWNRRLIAEEKQRKQVERALMKSNANFKNLIKYSPDPTWLIEDNKFILANLAAIQLLGYKHKKELIGLHSSQISPEFQPDGKSSVDAFNRYLEKAKTRQIQRFEWLYIKKDGVRFYAEVTLAPCTFNNRKIIYSSWRDITERKKNEAALIHLTHQLDTQVKIEVEKNKQKDALLQEQAKSAAMGEMIGNIAHQWRQPLNALNLILYDLEDASLHNECDSAYLKEAVAEANESIIYMSQTIDNFRHFFKTDHKPSSFSLKKIIMDCLSIVRASMECNQILITLDCPDDLVNITGYQHELAEVIMCLLGNAREAISLNNNTKGHITISVKIVENNNIVTISDNGGGIADDIMPKIFDPYFTSKAQGTGLGLYMSRTVMTKHINGQINAQNIAGGACFELVIPCN